MIKRRTCRLGIFPNDAAIERLVVTVLLEQDEHWQLEERRMFSAESMHGRDPGTGGAASAGLSAGSNHLNLKPTAGPR